jgi:hypothetical protein
VNTFLNVACTSQHPTCSSSRLRKNRLFVAPSLKQTKFGAKIKLLIGFFLVILHKQHFFFLQNFTYAHRKYFFYFKLIKGAFSPRIKIEFAKHGLIERVLATFVQVLLFACVKCNVSHAGGLRTPPPQDRQVPKMDPRLKHGPKS